MKLMLAMAAPMSLEDIAEGGWFAAAAGGDDRNDAAVALLLLDKNGKFVLFATVGMGDPGPGIGAAGGGGGGMRPVSLMECSWAITGLLQSVVVSSSFFFFFCFGDTLHSLRRTPTTGRGPPGMTHNALKSKVFCFVILLLLLFS